MKCAPHGCPRGRLCLISSISLKGQQWYCKHQRIIPNGDCQFWLAVQSTSQHRHMNTSISLALAPARRNDSSRHSACILRTDHFHPSPR